MRFRKRGALTAALAIALATGCAWMVKAHGFRYDEVERTPRPGDHPIPIIADTPSITRPYMVIGLVQADGAGMEGLGEREMKEGLRREARRMGGDALIDPRREPSIYGLPQHHVDDVGYRDSRPQGIKYRWVAEVITFDLPAEIAGDADQ